MSPHAGLRLVTAAMSIDPRLNVSRLSTEDERSGSRAQEQKKAFGDKKLCGKGEKMEKRGCVNVVHLGFEFMKWVSFAIVKFRG